MLLNGLSWRKIHDKNNLIKIEKNNITDIVFNNLKKEGKINMEI